MKRVKILLMLAFASLSAIAWGQDGTIDKGSGWLYFSGVPGTTPNVSCCAEIAMNVLTREAYVWNRDSSEWELLLEMTQGLAAPSGDPGSGPKLFLNRDDGLLYRWTGAAWEAYGSGGALSDGDYGDIDVSGSGTVMNIDTAVVGPIELASTAVTPGSYTNTSLTVDADGRITAASNGAAIDSSIYKLLPLGNVDIAAATNELNITGLGAVNFSTPDANIRIFDDDEISILSDNEIGIESSTRVILSNPTNNTQGAITLTTTSGSSIIFQTDTMYLSDIINTPHDPAILAFPEKQVVPGQDDRIYLSTADTLNGTWRYNLPDDPFPYAMLSLGADTSTMYWIHRDSLGGGTDTDNQTIDTFSRSGSVIYLSLEDDGEAAQQLNLSVFLQTLGVSRDTLSISGSGTQLRTPGPAFLRDSITGAALTVDLKAYNQAVVEIRMETCTSTTLTVNNPWSATDIDATYPTFEGETGVYSFHFLGISGTDNITWPADFLDMNGTALGTDALTTGTMYTCYRNPVSAKYYCK